MTIRTTIIINNLEDLKRFRRELEAIAKLDGRTVRLRFSQQGIATKSMLPKFPTFADAQKLVAAHHRDIGLSLPLKQREGIREFQKALFADRVEATASLREKLQASPGAMTRSKFIEQTNRVLRTGRNATFQRVLVSVVDDG